MRPMSRTAPRSTHHHGNLRQALIQAGIDLLEEGGISALTLRKCAVRAGVSHAAPAHHFDGLSGLKSAIAEEAFERFSTYLQTARDAGEQTDAGRLRSVCRGYLQFGIDHSGILNVIFGQLGLASLKPGNRETAHAYLILRGVCAPFVTAPMDPRVVEIRVWSLIHGFTLLAMSGEFNDADRSLDMDLFDAVMDVLPQIATPNAS
ncbi:TetR/AcrR family transcriptional regulator [Aliisedimentitalea scapharcae]|uniref:TetR/AcrR family transcriptional regulator n=1 Tax=Aliisedimentitalea scapharcae TaxID=1524259 RepID=A0ABZ2XRA7_9RHOB